MLRRRPGAPRTRSDVVTVVAGAVMVLLLLAVPVLVWRGLVSLPREYDALTARGVPVRLAVTACGPGVGGDSRGYGCRARFTFEGRTTTLRTDHDLAREESPDGTVAGVADPDHPGHVRLSEDLAERHGAGARGSEVFSAFLCACGAGLLGVLVLRRRPRAGSR